MFPCTQKRLVSVAAANVAIALNPANRPPIEHLSRLVPGFVTTPGRLALLTSKFWGSGGVKLTVGFVEPTSPELQRKILLHMNAWSAYCNVAFALAATDPQVRISRDSGGYWSYLGTDILHIPRDQQTMNLEGFTLSMPDSEFYRVVRHETGHCLSAGTLIDCPRDLKKYPLGIPISELVGQQPWVYAWKDGQIVVRRASRVWVSKKNTPTVRVRLRTGRGYHKGRFLPPLELVGTPDHPVLLADGKTWKNLGDLKAGDRLCSMYRSKNGQRTRVVWTGLRERIREHVFVAEQVYGERPVGHDCHHKDENKMNQSVENLEWKEESAHHSDHARGRKRSPEAIAATVAFWRGRHHTQEAREKMAESAKHRPPISDETREKISAQSKGRKQSEETVASRMAGMQRFYDSGGRSGMYGKKASEETRRKRSESMKATLARKRATANHVVVSVEPWLSQDVYDMTVPDADSFVANGVVVHNCLGFPHEHMRRELVARLDPQRTIQYFAQTQGWSAQEVQEQVLTPLEDGSLLRPDLSHADQDSIMCYQLPGSITIDGLPIHGGTDIDDSDKAFAGAMYPLPKTPPTPTPTPPPPPITGGKLLHTFTYDAADMGILLNPASPKSQKINSAVWLAGFASQMVFPASQAAPVFATPAGTVEDSTVQPHLRAIQSAHERGSDPAQLALPWGTILSWAIQLIAKLALGAAVGA